jgi:ethylbenzene dehydrogenase
MKSSNARKFALQPLGLAVALAFATGALAQTLTATKAAQAPKLEALAADPAWAKAAELKVELKNGKNFESGATTARLKALYTSDTLYILVQYADPTQSVQRSPYVKQADSSWKKLSDPDDKGGDNNKYYEDKLAFIWPIGNSIRGFDANGCFMLCHVGEAKPYGNKYTANEGELGDIWHMKSVRGGYIGQTDNQYVDHTRYDKVKAKDAGRKSDPKTGGGYADVKLVDGKPEFMSKGARAANKGGTYWIREEDKTAFDDGKFASGDEVASILVSKFTGERGAIDTAMGYKDGSYTVVMSRKLVTPGKFDVQFASLDAEYPFGVAAFDNAQVRHAFHRGALKLKFAT